MIRLSVLEIEGGTLSVTEEKEKEKDWSWSILVVGFITFVCCVCCMRFVSCTDNVEAIEGDFCDTVEPV